MKRMAIWLGLALAAEASGALAQEAYPGDARIARTEAAARAASVRCEMQLRGGAPGQACARYHALVLDAMGQENRRLDWCNARASEASNIPLAASCFGSGIGEMRLDAVMDLERKVAPKAWKDFDAAMGKVAR